MATLDSMKSNKFKKSTSSESQQQQQTQELYPSSSEGWNELYSNALGSGEDRSSKLADLGSSLGDDDAKRFEVATALAEQDLANRASGKRRNDKNLRDLTDQYFVGLGGDTSKWNPDSYRGTDNLLSQFVSNVNAFGDEIFGGIGDAIDWVGDNTIGNLVGLVDKDAGQNFKDAFTGDDLKWIPSTAFDIGTWLLPGAAPWKLAMLGTKGLLENADSLGRAITGVDSTTGEQLDGSQRFVNALAGLGGTALTTLPGAGIAKGARKAAGEKAVDKLVKQSFNELDNGVKVAKPGISAKEAEKLLVSDERPLSTIIEETPGLAWINDAGKKLPQGGLVETWQEVPEAIGGSFKNGLKNVKDTVTTKVADRKAAKKALNEQKEQLDTRIKQAQDLQKKLKDDSVLAEFEGENLNRKGFKEVIDNLKKERRELGTASQTTNKIKEARDNFSFKDMLKGQGLLYGNDMLQNSAELGADSENIFQDYSNLLQTEGLYPVALSHMLGLVPGLNNARVRKAMNPMTMYSARADLAKQGIQDQYNGAGIAPTDYDLALLAAALRDGNMGTAQKNVEDYFKEKAAASQPKESEAK